MDIETLRDYCISRKGATESFPFGEDTLVFKVKEKIFALANLDGDLSINLKCDPALALELRERYTAVTPGYHMNKKHWNTIILDGSVPDKEVFAWIDHSYDLISGKKRTNEQLNIRNQNSEVQNSYFVCSNVLTSLILLNCRIAFPPYLLLINFFSAFFF